MSIIKRLTLSLALAGVATAAPGQGGPPDGSTAQEKAIVAGDPPFHPSQMRLEALPKPVGPREPLFNGRDLAGWDVWLGMADPKTTYTGGQGQPIGLNKDATHVFSVVTEDGAPAIFSSGKLFGGILTKKSYGNYHLHAQFKWGEHAWIPNFPRNNGILYHSHGDYGAFFGTWMSAVEFEIVPHSVGMLLTVGASRGAKSFADVDWHVGAKVSVGRDLTIPYPYRRYMPGGRVVPVVVPAFNVEAASDAERPLGQWNDLDLYVVSNRSIHVVNGVPVMVAGDLTTVDHPGGKPRPLTSGRIQLQSEGAETYFRNVTIEPIATLPRVVAR